MSNFQENLKEIENISPLALFNQFEKLNRVMFVQNKENILNNNEDKPIRRDLYGEFYKAKMVTEENQPRRSKKRGQKSFVINTFASMNHKRSLSKEQQFSSRAVLKKKLNPLRASVGNFMKRNKSKNPSRFNKKKKTYLSTNYVNSSSSLIFEHLVKKNPRLLR